jgi:hypothetical protein
MDRQRWLDGLFEDRKRYETDSNRQANKMASISWNMNAGELAGFHGVNDFGPPLAETGRRLGLPTTAVLQIYHRARQVASVHGGLCTT